MPDFIFLRAPEVEEDRDLRLFGMLVSDIPKERELSDHDRERILTLIARLQVAVERDPDLGEAAVLLGVTDELRPLSFDAAMIARMEHCHVVFVRGNEGRGGFLRLSDGEVARLMRAALGMH